MLNALPLASSAAFYLQPFLLGTQEVLAALPVMPTNYGQHERLLAIVCSGFNDIFYDDRSPVDVYNGLLDIFDQITLKRASMVILTQFPPTVEIAQLNTLILSDPTKHWIIVDCSIFDPASRPDLFLVDNIHLSESGRELLAQKMYDTVVDSGYVTQ